MKLQQIYTEASRVAAQLECSIAVQELVPDAFSEGTARIQWSSRYPHKGREAFTVTINGKTSFRATDVPDCLWNDQCARYSGPDGFWLMENSGGHDQ